MSTPTTTILRTGTDSQNTRHIAGVMFECSTCREIKPVQTSGGTGYARYDEDNDALTCYSCADKRELERMKTATKFNAYVGSNATLTTWSGGKLGTIFFGARHPWSRERYYVTARDLHGNRWHGTGAPGMYCNLRKCKA